MSTEITQYQPSTDLNLPAVDNTGTALIMRAVEQMTGAHQLAQAMATTAFVPAHFRGKPEDVAAAIMYGAAVGLDPMSSLRAIYVVNGSPGMYARQMVAIVQAAGHQVWTEDSTDEAVTVAGQRRGSEHVERVTWTYARAKKAGYTSNKKYDTDPQAMLWARAASDVARRMAPDALAGLDTSVEELQYVDAVDVTPTRPRRESAAALLTQTENEHHDHPTPNLRSQLDAIHADVLAVQTEQAAPPVLMVTKSQLAKIAAQMRDLDITERTHALAYIEKAIGLKIASRSELTRDEAKRLIDALDDDLAQTNGDTDDTTSSPDGNAEG